MNFLDAAGWVNVAQTIALIVQGGAQLVQFGMMITLMNNLTSGEWLMEQARKWGLYFDQILVKYANDVYGYFVQIVNGTLFTDTVIDGLMSRLYIIVGVIIFFKLCTVAIKYIVSPETFLDAKTGGETLIKRIIYGTLIIVLLPLIFDIGMAIQSAIIKDDVIARIILPTEAYQEMTKDSDNVGKNLAMIVFLGFFGWNDTIDSSLAPAAYNNYQQVVAYNDAGLFKYKSYINNEVNGEYVISYVPIISTLALGYLLVQLVRYALEVALRSIKLAFLQIIAPFSIVKWMLDPSDDESLKKWINTTVSTYLIIFIRVMSLWLMALMAYYLKYGVPNGSDGTTSLITSDADELLKALIVIAMFAFLKELPKLISDLFGYNLQENETIGGVINQATGAIKGVALGKVGLSMQKGQMIAGGVASGAGIAAGGGISGGYNAVKSIKSGVQTGGATGFKQGALGVAEGVGQISKGTIISAGEQSAVISSAIGTNFGSSSIAPLSRNSYVQTKPDLEREKDEIQGSVDSNDPEAAKKAAEAGRDDATEAVNANASQSQPLSSQHAPANMSYNDYSTSGSTFDLSNQTDFDNFVDALKKQLISSNPSQATAINNITSEDVRGVINQSGIDISSVNSTQASTILNQVSNSINSSDVSTTITRNIQQDIPSTPTQTEYRDAGNTPTDMSRTPSREDTQPTISPDNISRNNQPQPNKPELKSSLHHDDLDNNQ